MERTPFVRDFRPIRRRGVERLARVGWGAGRSVWAADIGDRDLAVDSVEVTQEPAPDAVAGVMGLDETVNLCVRRRRFVLDGKPVLLSTSYLPADLVTGTPITEPDTGPGGVYARLADLGHAPARFREELRSRMPTQPEAERLELPPGAPVITSPARPSTRRGGWSSSTRWSSTPPRTSWSTTSRREQLARHVPD